MQLHNLKEAICPTLPNCGPGKSGARNIESSIHHLHHLQNSSCQYNLFLVTDTDVEGALVSDRELEKEGGRTF